MNRVRNISEIRADFPILSRQVYGKPLVYFDNGATTQKPQCVIDALTEVYSRYNSNIHRGVHFLSDMSSEAYENARNSVKLFINAGKREEIVFTSGTTGSINGIAFSFGERYIRPGDIILFHDSGGVLSSEGGDRTQTVKTIPRLARKLKEKGYRFVTISELMENAVE